jgi:hypothetical protein
MRYAIVKRAPEIKHLEPNFGDFVNKYIVMLSLQNEKNPQRFSTFLCKKFAKLKTFTCKANKKPSTGGGQLFIINFLLIYYANNLLL